MVTEKVKTYNVLLVEDNPADAERMEYLLEEAESVEFKVKTVIRVREALLEIKENKFDLILLDISLPDGLGAENVESINSIAQNIPIIVITGRDEEELANECIKAGAKDYIVKGITNPDIAIKTIGYSLIKEKHSGVSELEKTIAHYKSLSSIGSSTSITASLSGSGAIKERHSDKFESLIAEYAELLGLYLDQLVTKKPKPTFEMESIITNIGDLGGGPRDLLDIHLGALDVLILGEDAGRGQSFAVEGRLLALEMMGLLVDYYRVGQRRRFL